MPKALSLSLALSEKVSLFPEDPGDDSYVIVKQATQAAVERIAEVNSVSERSAGDDTIRTFFNAADVVAIEVYETLAECNLESEPGGAPIFPSENAPNGQKKLAMTEGDFRAKWKSLPPDWCERIHKAVIKVNPIWDPEERKKSKLRSGESGKKQ